MTFKKAGLVPLTLLLAFLSCTTRPDVPLVHSYTVPATTTTTLKPPVLTAKQSQTISDPLPKVILPSVLEPEFRNLYALAHDSYKELLSYEINKLFPVPSSELTERFEKARMNYEIQIWRWPYDGEASYPFFVELKALGQQLSALVDKGLPIRSEEERVKALSAADQAKAGKAAVRAAHRVTDAEAALGSGNTFHTGAKYRSSIAFYKKASILFASAAAKALAESAKTENEASGLNRFSPFLIIEADRLMAEDTSLYALSDNDSVEKGISQLNWATRLYNQALSWGMECQAMVERDRALIAKQHASLDYAEINAAEGFSKAASLFADAEVKLQSGGFIEAAAFYKDSVTSYEAAQAAARLVADDARIAREVARIRLNNQKASIESAGLDEDANFQKARLFLALADEKLQAASFENSRLDSMEVLNHLAISNRILEEKLVEKRAALQADADRRAAEQTRQLAQKQAEIESLIKEKARIAEKLAEVEAQLSNALTANPEPIKSSNLPGPVAEMETAVRQLEAENVKLQEAVANAKTEIDRLIAERIKLERVTETIVAIPEPPKPTSATLPIPPIPPALPEQPAPQPPAPEPAPEITVPKPPVLESPVSEIPVPQAPAIQEPIIKEPAAVEEKPSETVTEEVARAAAAAVMEEALKKLEWAISKNAAHNYASALAKGRTELDAATLAFEAKVFAAASSQAASALESFSGIAEFAEYPMYYHVGDLPGRNGVDSLSRIAGYPFVYSDPIKWPFLYSANRQNLPNPSNPDLIRWNQLVLIPSIRGETRSGTWDPKKTYRPFDKNDEVYAAPRVKKETPAVTEAEREAAKANAQAALDNCRKTYDQAVQRNSKNNYPALLEKGAAAMAAAETAFKSGDFLKAAAQADSARQTLAAIKEFAPLPARYTVRRIPSGTDSFWQIAGYPFVYGNSYKWQRLLEANRSLHPNSSNPTLLIAGDVMVIPSLAGEVREGMWDPKKTYPPLPR